MYLEHVECVNGITDIYPNADVVISSILPRAPRKDCTYNQLNTEIMDLNNKLCKLESDASHIMFFITIVNSWTMMMIDKNYIKLMIKLGCMSTAEGQKPGLRPSWGD